MKCLLLSLLLVLPTSLFAEGGVPDKPYIYVVGKAEMQKSPDVVTLKFDLVGRAPEQAKANEDVQSKANKIFALLKERKIADNDVIAEDLRSEPEFEQIKIRDVATFPKLADELIRVQGAEFSGVEGGLSKEKELQEQLGDKALADARAKAEKSLKPMNLKIDAVFAVTPISPAEIEGKIFGEITRLGVRGSEAAARAEPPPEYRLAPVSISQEAHVIYLISPAK
jgi:uncharacterized protein YggE